jgi:hypothetical protein
MTEHGEASVTRALRGPRGLGTRNAAWHRFLLLMAAQAAVLGGAIHLLLTPEHFEESLLFGVVFSVIALYQLVLAALLVAWPGPTACRLGIWGSLLIAATYVLTRIIPPPGASDPEPNVPLGVAATVAEVLTMVLLVLALPEETGLLPLPVERRPSLPPALSGLAVALVTPPLWLLVTGTLQWVTAPLPGPPLGLFPGPISRLTPALYGVVSEHLYLFLPWWTGLAAMALGALAGANVWLATRLRRQGQISCRRQRAGLLGLFPAVFAAPVCCSLPLGALLGLSTATLFAVGPLTTAVALALLSLNLGHLCRGARAPHGSAC